MHFSNTLGDTDVKQATFCARCQPRAARGLLALGRAARPRTRPSPP
jgi:predicted Zn-dependent protease